MAQLLKSLLGHQYLEAKHLAGFDSYKVGKKNLQAPHVRVYITYIYLLSTHRRAHHLLRISEAARGSRVWNKFIYRSSVLLNVCHAKTGLLIARTIDAAARRRPRTIDRLHDDASTSDNRGLVDDISANVQ